MPVPYLGRTALRWQVGRSAFLAMPELGARLMRWTLARADGSTREVLHWPPVASLDDFATARGGNPILFPFCARTFVDGTIHLWRDALGRVRPMPLHGFARQSAFRVTALVHDGFTAELAPGPMAHECYPFEYRFEVRYHFRKDGFRVELALANLGPEPIAWSAGHHFYFIVPWTVGRRRADYAVAIPSPEAWRQDPAGGLVPVATTGEVPLTSEALLATMHGALTDEAMELRETASGASIRVAMPGCRLEFPEAVFTTWTQDEAAPYYCLEPWMGPANAPGLGRGVHRVPPGGRQLFPVDVRIEDIPI
jgi:galactose mutarotase-like enzyme